MSFADPQRRAPGTQGKAENEGQPSAPTQGQPGQLSTPLPAYGDRWPARGPGRGAPPPKREVLGHFGGKLENGNVGITLFLKRVGAYLMGTYVAPSGEKYAVEGTQTGEQTITLRTLHAHVQVEITGVLAGQTFTGVLRNPKKKYVSPFTLNYSEEQPEEPKLKLTPAGAGAWGSAVGATAVGAGLAASYGVAGPQAAPGTQGAGPANAPETSPGQAAGPQRAWAEKHAFSCVLKHGGDSLPLSLRDLHKKADGALSGTFETESGSGHLYGTLYGGAVTWTAVYTSGTLGGKRRQFRGTMVFGPGGAPQALRGEWLGTTATGESAAFALSGEHTENVAPTPGDDGPWLYSQDTIEALIRVAPAAGRAGGKNISPEQARRNIPLIMAAAKKAKITNPSHIAYILATAAHESEMGASMFERYNGEAREYFSKKYDHRADIGNRGPGSGDGYNYRGRGFVQLTGKKNYDDWDNRLNEDQNLKSFDIRSNPDLVGVNREVAAKILVEGMQKGTFTGVGLGKYTNDKGELNFVDARRVVNGLDKAELIKKQALKYMEALDVQNEEEGVQEREKAESSSAIEEVSEVGKLICSAALAGLDGETESLAYYCSKWVRQITERAMGRSNFGLKNTLFGDSAKLTYDLCQDAGLIRPYSEGDLEPGDFIFWPVPAKYWHIAIYVGGGKVAGNHYSLYKRKERKLRALGKPLGPVVMVGDMPVYKNIDARGVLTIEEAAGKPIACARVTQKWRKQ